MRIDRVLAVLGIALLPGCVVVPVAGYHEGGSAAEVGAAMGALIGAAMDRAVGPPPGAVWDPYAGVWRLP